MNRIDQRATETDLPTLSLSQVRSDAGAMVDDSTRGEIYETLSFLPDPTVPEEDYLEIKSAIGGHFAWVEKSDDHMVIVCKWWQCVSESILSGWHTS